MYGRFRFVAFPGAGDDALRTSRHGIHRLLQHAIALGAALGVSVAATARAQSATEFWPELDVFWRPAEHQRTLLELSSSTERESKEREATIGLYQDYLRLPAVYFRGGYRFTFSTHDASYRESRIVGEITATAHTWGRIRLVNRSRGELRWVNDDYSYRIRDRLHLQRTPVDDQRGRALGPYVTFEAYYDSRYNTIARLGGRVGSDVRINNRVIVDPYVARQNNSRGTPVIVNALGITMKFSY
jgi:hypothetical protein